MPISDFLNFDSLDETLKKKRISTRFHIFYEGRITEVELINNFIKNFDEIPEIYNYFKLSLNSDSIQSINKLIEILDLSEYKDINTLRTMKILDNDYILFLLDFDVFYDYRNGQSSENSKRIIKLKNTFNNFLNTLTEKYSNLNIFILGSYPSVEYALCLGCDINLNGSYLSSNLKKECVSFLSNAIGVSFGTKKKSYKRELYKTNLFEVSRFLTNAKRDKLNKSMCLNINEFMEDIKIKGVESYVLTQIPFTYIDGIIHLMKNIIEL